ncbi:M14 family zinc carboxypeptidase [Polaribacter filamentus]
MKRKSRVWMQGGLHGDESASTEGMLYLIHQLLNDENIKYFR